MKKSIFNLEGVQPISKEKQAKISGGTNPGGAYCGKYGFPPCWEN